MPVTVKQILDLPLLSDARLLAGKGGLGRRVTSVTVGEVPDIADWLSGGELVLSTMFAFQGDVEKQRDFCRRVMLADAAALFVKTTRFVQTIPDDVLALAEKRNFPIVEVPKAVRWTRLMEAATELIIDRQASLLSESQALHHTLLEVVIRGGDWKDLARELARLVGRPVLLLDSYLEILALSPEAALSEQELAAALKKPEVRALFEELGRSRKVCSVRESGLPPMFVQPVVASNERRGYVCVLTEQEVLNANQIMTLEHGATIAALEAAQDRVRFETEVRLRGDFVDAVTSGEVPIGDSLLRRGVFLGLDLSQGAAVMLGGVDEAEGLVARRNLDPETLEERIDRLFVLAGRRVRQQEGSSLVSLKSRRLVIFVGGATGRDVEAQRRLAVSLQNIAEKETGVTLSVGISNFASHPEQMSAAYQQALVALKVGRKLIGPGAILHFQEAGSYRLLLDIWERDPGQVMALYEETIAPLDRYDEKNGTKLTETLIVFFRNNENLNQTAADLYAHRHTVRYRLEKIAELTGLSVYQTEHKERLSLGLKARTLITG
ncbi:MAG: PucR family transcriptional regulator ligand-binding domain-containing protein [Thermoleophilia bacterium]|nr:PucR family transcriptional regulator ligand-binding domain-containing protein [Thermoleophilia bacterium]